MLQRYFRGKLYKTFGPNDGKGIALYLAIRAQAGLGGIPSFRSSSGGGLAWPGLAWPGTARGVTGRGLWRWPDVARGVTGHGPWHWPDSAAGDRPCADYCC